MKPNGKVCALPAVEPFSLHSPFQVSWKTSLSGIVQISCPQSVIHQTFTEPLPWAGCQTQSWVRHSPCWEGAYMGQWESCQLTKLPSLYSPLLFPNSRQQAQQRCLARQCTSLLPCFVLVVSNLNASSPGKPFLILSTLKSHVVHLILSCSSSPALVYIRAPGGLDPLQCLQFSGSGVLPKHVHF